MDPIILDPLLTTVGIPDLSTFLHTTAEVPVIFGTLFTCGENTHTLTPLPTVWSHCDPFLSLLDDYSHRCLVQPLLSSILLSHREGSTWRNMPTETRSKRTRNREDLNRVDRNIREYWQGSWTRRKSGVSWWWGESGQGMSGSGGGEHGWGWGEYRQGWARSGMSR